MQVKNRTKTFLVKGWIFKSKQTVFLP